MTQIKRVKDAFNIKHFCTPELVQSCNNSDRMTFTTPQLTHKSVPYSITSVEPIPVSWQSARR